MRIVATGLLLLVSGCKNNDLISTVPEPTPDAPVVDAGPHDMGPDLRCTLPLKCDTSADCDDCDDCTSDTCVGGICMTADVPCGCCYIQSTPGCGNAKIEQCVCNGMLPMGEECCEMDWDITCVDDFSMECGGECGCCTPHSEPGCYSGETLLNSISNCVCAKNALCCKRNPGGFGWDADCVALVAGCGGTCP